MFVYMAYGIITGYNDKVAVIVCKRQHSLVQLLFSLLSFDLTKLS